MAIRVAIITTGFSKDENDYGGASAFHNFVKELSNKVINLIPETFRGIKVKAEKKGIARSI